MNEFSPTRSLDEDIELSTPSSSGYIIKKKREDVNTQNAFPEGGLRAWSTIAGAFLVQFTGFGYVNSFGVYQDFYVREYLTGYTPSEIGWIGGIQLSLTLSLGAITGRLFDRGYFYHLMISSIMIHAFSLFALSFSHKNVYYQVILTNGVGMGLASGLTYTASLSIPAHHFRIRRSFVLGIVSSGSALGAVVHPILLNKLINGSVGFHTAVKISAALNIFLLVIAGSLMRTRLPRKEIQSFPILQWLREPAYLAFVLSGIVRFIGLFFPVFYLQLYSITRGVDREIAFYALSVFNAASVLGRIIPGAIANKVGVLNLGTAFAIGTGVISLSMITVKDSAGTMIFAILLGLFSGACIALMPAILAQLTKDPKEIGTRLGLYLGFGGIVGLFATPVSGALLTKQYHWINPVLLAGISVIVSGFLYGVSRHYVAKKEGSQIV